MDAIDARTAALLREAAGEVGGDSTVPPTTRPYRDAASLSYSDSSIHHRNRPQTVNPSAEDLPFTPRSDRNTDVEREYAMVAGRLDEVHRIFVAEAEEQDMVLDLVAALATAQRNAREFRTAEEEYILSALRLLIERHLWGPRFFDDVSATVVGSGDDGKFDTALRLVNELRVTQRLPYGGDVSARMLARATEDLHQRVAGENVQSAEIILSANVPLLRGAGMAARESRVQTERDLIYDARGFEDFRRGFLVDIASEFLNLVVQQQTIRNAESQLTRLHEFLEREQQLAEAGRQTAFDVALAEQNVLFAVDRLRGQRVRYRFAVDRFKVRIGIPIDQPVIIAPSTLGLPVPELDINEAVRAALTYRLDLQTRRDRVDDSLRRIEIAKNNLLPDLDLAASTSIPTDRDRDRAGLRFEPDDLSFAAGITFGLPLDREIERLQLRQAQISFESAQRDYALFRDNLVIQIHNSVREIERALFSLELQERNIVIAQRRLDAIEAAPDRASARDRSDAADGLTRAEDDRDLARRDLEVAILEYLLNTGMLRVNEDGSLRPLSGMVLGAEDEPGDDDGQPDEAGAGGGGG